jgi:hypothetical protein
MNWCDRKYKLIIVSALCLFLSIGLINCSGKDGNGISLSKNREIDLIKNGVLELDKTVTVGNALEGYKYFNKKEWKVVEDSQKRKSVEFYGTIDLPSVYEGIEPKLKQDLLSTVNDSVYYVKFNISADNKSFSVAGGGEKVSFKNGKKYEDDQDAQSLLISGALQNIFKNQMISLSCRNQYIVEKYMAFPLTQEEREKLENKYKQLDARVGELWRNYEDMKRNRAAIEQRELAKRDAEKDRDDFYKERDKVCNAQSGESTKLNCLIQRTEQKVDWLKYEVGSSASGRK